MSTDPTSIRKTLAGKHILLTGVTGFLGKVWVAFLLEYVPEIGKITVLVRSRRRQTAGARVRQVFEHSPAMRRLREHHGEGLHEFLKTRIDVVAGDAGQPLMGIDSQVLAELTPKLDLVVHCAGLTDFAPDPIKAIAVNVYGADHAADVAALIPSRRLLHVSTCFVAGMVTGAIPEDPVDGVSPNGTRFDVRAELVAIESACAAINKREGNPKTLAARRGRLELATDRGKTLGWPNVYTFSKGLAEHVLALRDDVETTIVRPSIVECAREFPFEGWNEGLNTAGPIVWMCTGYAWKVPMRAENHFDVTPVDTVGRGLTLAAADALLGRAAPVYHLANGDHNPFKFGRALDLAALTVRRGYVPSGLSGLERLLLTHLDSTTLEHGADRSRLLPAAQRATNWLRDRFLSFDSERHLPKRIKDGQRAQVAERVQSAGLKLNIAQKTLRQIENLWEMYQPFVHDYDYIFQTDAVRASSDRLIEEERETFGWDLGSLDWRHYWMDVEIPGLDKWSMPIIRGKDVPEDEGLDLGADLIELGQTKVESQTGSKSESTALSGNA